MISDVIPAVIRVIALSKIMNEAGYDFHCFKAVCLANNKLERQKDKLCAASNEQELVGNMDFYMLKILCELKDVFDDNKAGPLETTTRVSAANFTVFVPRSGGDALEIVTFARTMLCRSATSDFSPSDIRNQLEVAFNFFIKYGESTNNRDGTPLLIGTEKKGLQDTLARTKCSMRLFVFLCLRVYASVFHELTNTLVVFCIIGTGFTEQEGRRLVRTLFNQHTFYLEDRMHELQTSIAQHEHSMCMRFYLIQIPAVPSTYKPFYNLLFVDDCDCTVRSHRYVKTTDRGSRV